MRKQQKPKPQTPQPEIQLSLGSPEHQALLKALQAIVFTIPLAQRKALKTELEVVTSALHDSTPYCESRLGKHWKEKADLLRYLVVKSDFTEAVMTLTELAEFLKMKPTTVKNKIQGLRKAYLLDSRGHDIQVIPLQQQGGK